jgi:UDP-4-amino-4,6-dideoxy-N-acetyl-beta-L-altrosamine transaminase
MKMIPYGKQDISDDDIDAVVAVLKSDFITQGPKVPKFEAEISRHCKGSASKPPFAVATNSATSALHIACLALEVGKGDAVWTSPISFVASSNCALYCGADINFVDIDIHTGNISSQCLADKLAQAAITHTLPKVVIVVHLAGQSCEMEKIKKLSEQYKFFIIEDASHAIGAAYNMTPVGSCAYSDITVFSFHPVKVITSAEGGMALTNDANVAKKLRLFRSHGVTGDPQEMTEESHGPWYYQQVCLGFNYRMTELQAALGLSQRSRLDDFVKKRNQLAKIYDEAFKETSLSILKPLAPSYSSYHLYIVLLSEADADKHRHIIEKLRSNGIFAHVHYIPIHIQPYYQNLGFAVGDFPVAENYYKRAISLPLFPHLETNDQIKVIDTLINLLRGIND